MDFPIFKTKVAGADQKFDLSSPQQRAEYFRFKVGPEIEKIKKFLEHDTFIAYFLGKKMSGKGTYTKLMAELFGGDKIMHISAGDIIRAVHEEVETEEGRNKLEEYLKENYRGYISIGDCIKAILNRTQDKVSIPDQLMLILLKREIDSHPGKTLFIDGFPRTLDQVSYSLFFRDLINHRDDPDAFILIDVPHAVIEERIKYRVICPKCHTSRNIKLFPTSKIEYTKETGEFYLVCDNPECGGEKMVRKEGDHLGTALIKDRLEQDGQLVEKALELHGVPKILLRNSVPVAVAEEYVDDYEKTPEYSYEQNQDTGEIKIKEGPWTIKNDAGELSYSLLAPPVVVALIKQIADTFCS